MNKLKRLLALTVTVAIMLTTFAFPVSAANEQIDFKAVWISTVYNLDYPKTMSTDPAVLKKQADTILDNSKAMGFNAIIFQVRPSSDALYPSELFPWSKYLTGSCGTAPSGGFDPLQYWVDGAHARGMELHAWINPYRVTKDKDKELSNLPSNHPAVQHPEWVIKHTDGNYYYDPAIPEVRQMVVDGAVEIAENYDVDGIHMDDYFYPGPAFPDSASFSKYGSGFSNLDDWRRDNVNQLIQGLDEAIHAVNSKISFGVSPFGIWANKSTKSEGSNTKGNQSYAAHYADTRKWVKEGWIDYICPQIYWYAGFEVADYVTLAKWWADTVRGTDCELYIGLPDYRVGTSTAGDPWYGIDAIRDQMAINRTIPEISGEIHFRYKFLLSVPGLRDFCTSIYKNNSNIGTFTRYQSKDKSGYWVKSASGSWKFQKKNGTYFTGWKKIDGVWYYFGSGAKMVSGGWQTISSKKYYFNNSGVMLSNTTTPDGYRVNSSGERI